MNQPAGADVSHRKIRGALPSGKHKHNTHSSVGWPIFCDSRYRVTRLRELDSPCCPYAPFAGARHLSAARPTLASKICRSPAGDNTQRKRDKVTAQLYASIVAFMGI